MQELQAGGTSLLFGFLMFSGHNDLSDRNCLLKRRGFATFRWVNTDLCWRFQ